jgi:hypothetical protein
VAPALVVVVPPQEPLEATNRTATESSRVPPVSLPLGSTAALTLVSYAVVIDVIGDPRSGTGCGRVSSHHAKPKCGSPVPEGVREAMSYDIAVDEDRPGLVHRPCGPVPRAVLLGVEFPVARVGSGPGDGDTGGAGGSYLASADLYGGARGVARVGDCLGPGTYTAAAHPGHDRAALWLACMARTSMSPDKMLEPDL